MKFKMSRKNVIIIFVIILVVAFVILKTVVNTTKNPSGKYDDFAQCITDSGAKFYGAYWCPACNAQKDRFGESAKLLPFVECSQPDSKDQNLTCRKEGIEAYPTWKFKDGSAVSENLSFEALAEKTGCNAPKIDTSVQ